MAARKVSMVAQRECVRVRGLWCGPLGGDIAKGPGRGGAVFFSLPPPPLQSRLQSTESKAAKVCRSESQGSTSRPPGRRDKQGCTQTYS